MIPDMTLAALRQLPVEPFPYAASWHFREFIKYSFLFQQPEFPCYNFWVLIGITISPPIFSHLKETLFSAEPSKFYLAYRESCHCIFQYLPCFANEGLYGTAYEYEKSHCSRNSD